MRILLTCFIMIFMITSNIGILIVSGNYICLTEMNSGSCCGSDDSDAGQCRELSASDRNTLSEYSSLFSLKGDLCCVPIYEHRKLNVNGIVQRLRNEPEKLISEGSISITEDVNTDLVCYFSVFNLLREEFDKRLVNNSTVKLLC